MNQGLQQRLLGILVLVALASVLLPLLLDFRNGYEVDTDARIPPPPDIRPAPLPQLDPPPDSAPAPAAPAADAAPQPPFQLPDAEAREEVVEPAQLPAEPGLDQRGLPGAWVLQLGAFQQEKNALELRDRLLAGGHRAFVQRSGAGEPIAYRVFVGPKLTRDQLVAEQRELERKFRVKPLVVPFTP